METPSPLEQPKENKFPTKQKIDPKSQYSVDYKPGETKIADSKGEEAVVSVVGDKPQMRYYADEQSGVKGHWAVVDANALEISNVLNNVTQNRDMSTKQSREMVAAIANGLKNNPSQTLESRTVDHGAPTVIAVEGKDGKTRLLVHFGNHRAQATINGYSDAETAKALRSAVTEYAQKNNIDISNIQNPMLVFIESEAQTVEQLQQGTQRGNHTATRQMTPSQNAQSDALLLAQHPEVLKKFVPGGNLATENFDFLRNFMQITDTMNAGLLDEKNRPTMEAENRVARAMFAYFLRNESPERQERMLKSVIDNAGDNNIVLLVRGIMSNAPALAQLEERFPDYALGKEMINALDSYLEYKRARGKGEFNNIENWFNQTTMDFGDRNQKKLDLNDVEKDLARIFDKVKTIKGIRTFFNAFTDTVREDAGGEGLFSDVQKRTKAEIIHDLAQKTLEPEEDTSGTTANASVENESTEHAPRVESARVADVTQEENATPEAVQEKRKNIDDAVRVAQRLFPNYTIHIHDNIADIPEAHRAQIPKNGIPECYNDGKNGIHIIVENMPSDPATIRQRIMSHEIVGHDGLKQLLGKRYDKMLDSVYADHENDIIPIANRYHYAIETVEGRRMATEEWLAHNANIENRPSWFNRLVAKIRATLRTMFNIKWSDNDIRSCFIEAARNLQEQSGSQHIRFAISDSQATLDAAARKLGIDLASETQEFQDVFRRYYNTPQWMKAPNGKPTNLTARQWCQTRTSAFKRWFGDYEKAYRFGQINSLQAIQLRPIPTDADIHSIYGKLENGKNELDGKEVRFVNSTLGKILRHKGFNTALIIPQLKEIFDKSIPLGFQEERRQEPRPDGSKHKEHSNFVGYHNYLGKISLADKGKTQEYYVRFTVQELHTRKKDFVPNELHSTYVSDVEIINADLNAPVNSQIINRATDEQIGVEKTTRDSLSQSTMSVDERGKVPGIDNILIQYLNDFKSASQNSSKIVDENGAPMVVYHGTEGNFTVFDRTKGRANMDIQGMFFSPWEDDARGYGSRLMPCFLNIRHPASEGQAYKALKAHQGENNAGVKAREDLIAQGFDGVNNENEEFIAFEPTQIKSATDNVGTFSRENPDIRFSLVTDAKVKDEFQDSDKYIETYRSAMLGEDGKLYPPMATRGGEGMELGQVYRSDERPELRNKKGKFPLKSDMRDSGKQGNVGAAYNPYFHSQLGVLNDQFAVAYDKSRMVTVKCRVLKSDLESGYWAEGAKDPVGYAEWDTSGPVTNQLRHRGGRTVILSRYIMPVEIVPDSEVARMIKEQIGGEDVTVPWNVVPPNLRNELVKTGVNVGSEEEFRQQETEKNTKRKKKILPTKGKVDGGIRWSIKTFPNGKKYVKVNTDQAQFDGLNADEAAQLARKIILEKYRNKIIGVAPDNAFVNRRSAEEYAYPAKSLDDDLRYAKSSASPELDNLMLAGRNRHHEADDGHHPEATGGWDYYDVTFQVGEDFFEGKINVMITDRGRRFHDVTDLKKDTSHASGSRSSQDHITGGVPTNILPTKENASQESGEKVKFSLTEQQKQQINTPDFKRWFGDSQAVDSEGNPLIVYRRDNERFNIFDFNKTQQTDAGWLGKGFYFYGDRSEAERSYAYGKNLRQFYLRAENPYYITEEEYNELVEANDKEKSAEFTQRLIDEGYDSVYWNGDLRQEWVVFEPTQIKSATDNVGTFSNENPDIRFSLVSDAKKMAENAKKRLGELWENGIDDLKEKITVGETTHEVVEAANSLGISMTDDVSLELTASELQHVKNRHPELTSEDIQRIVDTWLHPQYLGVGDSKIVKRLFLIGQDDSQDVLEVVILGLRNKQAHLKTFYKGGKNNLLNTLKQKSTPLVEVANSSADDSINHPSQPIGGAHRITNTGVLVDSNILPTKENANPETPKIKPSLVAEQPTPGNPDSVDQNIYADHVAKAVAQTPIENLRAMRLPLILELARKLKGDVKAVDGIPILGARGVFHHGSRLIEVLRELAKPQLLEKDIIVPQADAARQRQLWEDYWTKAGVPLNEIEIVETPVGGDVRMHAIRHDRTLARFRKTAAHEVGHLIDYNTGETTSHGNVLGTVGGMLQRWLMNVIGETPSTQVDKASLNQLRKQLHKQAETIVSQTTPKPKSTDKAALDAWRQAVSDKYHELFVDECDRNAWFRREVVREEMVDLTRWWSGEFFGAKPSYVEYRMKPTELFAETMSVLLNAPDELMKRSPETWRLIQNYQSNKPEFHKAWRQLMDLMNDETAYAKSLLEIQRRGFDAGEVAALAAIRNNPSFSFEDSWMAFKRSFVNKFANIADASKQVVRNGQMVFDDMPLAAITAAQHASVKDYYMKMANRLAQPLLNMGLTEKDIGLYMQNKRIENDPSLNDTDRGILNPNGLTAEDATLALEELHRQLGDKK